MLQSWANRGGSLLGKILITNSSAGSLFVHKMQVLNNISNKHINCFYEIIHQYLWGTSKEQINMDLLKLPKDQGGQWLVDIVTKQKALKIKWIAYIKNDPFFAEIASEPLIPNWGLFIWQCNLMCSDVNKVISRESYWRQLLTAWCDYHYFTPETPEDVQNQVLWCNSHIKINNTPIAWQKPMSVGINKIKDLISDTGVLFTL